MVDYVPGNLLQLLNFGNEVQCLEYMLQYTLKLTEYLHGLRPLRCKNKSYQSKPN